MKRVVILGSLVAAGAFAIAVAQQPPPAPGGALPGGLSLPPVAPVDKIEKVADNLYRILGGGGNSAVLVRADGVLLVDTKLPGNGQKLLDLIRSVTDKPVTHIINTHTHGDHNGSNAFFPAIVEVVVQANTAANMQKMDIFKTEEGKAGLPDRTFDDRMTLFGSKDAVDLYYFGPAHTNGDAFVVFRDARIMHAGDTFSAKRMPIVDVKNGGSGLGYGETIGKAVAGIRNVDRVITGHSDVMTWQDFVDYGEFNRLMAQHARTSLAAGKSAEQAMIDFKPPAKFEGYNMVPAFGGPAATMAALYGELKK